jgi:hypothetical protein
LGIGPSIGRSRELGKLVQFEGRRKGRAGGKPDRSGSAEILIFTGVRYERESSNAPTKPPASSGAKRKRG